MNPKLAIIIPAYNEATILAHTIKSIRKVSRQLPKGYHIVVVDDGSTDDTSQIAQKSGAIVLRHKYNCGLGAALGTGIEYARRKKYHALITFDADGQHSAIDIVRANRRLILGDDVLVGSRFLGSHEHMPASRRIILWCSNLITYLFFGVWTTDSQSGFRALSGKAIRTLGLRSNRMEVSSEFFGEIRRHNLRYGEMPIHVKYTKYSLAKGQKNTASLSVLLKLLYLLGR